MGNSNKNNNSGSDGDCEVCNSNLNNNNNNNTVYYLLNAFNNSFSNISLKFSTSQEIDKIIKSLKLQNTYEYDSPSVCHGTTRLPLDGFSLNLIFYPFFRKSVEIIQVLLISDKINGYITWSIFSVNSS